MKYVEVNFICNPYSEAITDILAHQLSEIEFESFLQSNSGVLAYVPEAKFSVSKVDDLLRNFLLDVKIDYSFKVIDDVNWNEEWEKHYFQPIVFENKCIIHSSFHQPEGEYDYRILIDPKMSFGTGHHQTTGLILKEILSMSFFNKTVLDMGCGTAVLAILASMRGAREIAAIDIDEWAYNNALENIKLNHISNVKVKLGGAELLGKETFDIIFANINRNILLQDIPIYTKVLNKGGSIVMSGFYKEDIAAIREKCEQNGLIYRDFSEMDNWVAVVCER
ncbi:MAG: 50S ribosomal protein L11 methyltransferase [Bacteroidia bacterium]|nr:50S ribosomal protein L11 methyltransferase [Bacteroidia bacterium]